MPKIELFGTARCPHTTEVRDWLVWRGSEFIEYDVEADPPALMRMRELTSPPFAVPVLVEDGQVVQVGWQGRSCAVKA